MKSDEIILRRSKRGYIFYSPDRYYKSEPFKTAEDREVAIEKYINQQISLQKEVELRRKKEYELTHE